MMIDWIDFGQVSAERDNNLSEYFFENDVLQSTIKNKYMFLVLGRKGAGKTAVFQHLNENPNKYLKSEDFLIALSLQDYSWDIHGLLAAEGKAPSMAYIQSWRYIIYLLAVKQICSMENPTGKMKEASRIIEKIYSSPVPSLGQVIGQKLLQLSRLRLPRAGFDLDSSDLDSMSFEGGEIAFSDVSKDDSLQSKMNQTIERLTDIFETALIERLTDRSRVFIAFDRIDEAWDSTSFEMSQRIIAGLIGASELVISKFKGALRPIVFLREDIFETLDLNDKNKLKSDCGRLLAWKKESLARLIMERVNYFARVNNIPELSKIEEIFDKEQMRQQRAPFDHIMLRTMLRPRDFIKFFQLAKLDMVERRDNPFDDEVVNSKKIECQSIYNVEASYSEWLVEELRDEWGAQFPMINKLLEALQNNGETNFNKSNLHASLKKVGIEANEVKVTSY